MDLLFKNPSYFFETYFAVSPIAFLFTFCICCVMMSLLCRKRFDSRVGRVIFVFLSSIYLATLIGVTLLNTNRIGTQALNLNPITNIQELFGEMPVHQWRGGLSNIVFFVPFGILGAVYFKKGKVVYSVLAGFLTSLIIEVLQYILHRGCVETMDVICNTIGALVGSLLAFGIDRLWNIVNRKNRNT